MVALIWLINILLPIVTILGIIGMGWGLDDAPFELCLWGSLGCFIVGFIFGLVAWKYEVPPRWFWIKSKTGLFENYVGSAFGYGFKFAFIPFAILGIMVIVDAI